VTREIWRREKNEYHIIEKIILVEIVKVESGMRVYLKSM